MAWIGTPATVPVRPAGRWIGTPEPVVLPRPAGRWIGVKQLTAPAGGIGTADASIVARVVGTAPGVGAPAATSIARIDGRTYAIGDPRAVPIIVGLIAAAEGEGTPSADAVRHLLAAAEGVGVASAALAARIVAAATGTGVASAADIVRGVIAAAEGTGAPGALIVPTTGGVAAGVGSSSATITARLVAAATGMSVEAAVARVVVALQAQASGTGAASAPARFPVTAAVITPLPTSGNYTVPWWSHVIDRIGVGGGGGALNGGFTNGAGGKAGKWDADTIARGSIIPWSQTTIAYTVGAGGTNGALSGAGGLTTFGAVMASGGAGGVAFGSQPGESPGNFTYNGETYIGGVTATNSTIRVPGTGGFGGGFFGSGSTAGGRGQCWARAYQTS